MPKKKTEYLTAKQLGLKPTTYKYLIQVQKNLKTGRFSDYYGSGNVFDMSAICHAKYDCVKGQPYKCGTAACLGGWMAILALGIRPGKKHVYNLTPTREAWAKRLFRKFVKEGRLLIPPNAWTACHATTMEELFYPGCHHTRTAKQAVKVIEHFRKTGNVEWERFAD